MAPTLPATQTQLVLLRRPIGPIDPSLSGEGTFGKKAVPVTKPHDLKPDEAILAVEWLSLDPAMRGWLNDTRSYVPPVKIGEVMRAGGVGKVAAVGKDVKNVAVGDYVYATCGWQEFATLPAKHLTKLAIPPAIPPSYFLGTLGMPGQTAYWGLLDICQPQPGELVVVSGAAGAVGSLVCQIAKLKGCRVVGIAGGRDKCQWLRDELGVEALDYKSESFRKDFRAIGYVHCYFDNVGGEILDLVLTRLQIGARIALCGAIADYNTPTPSGLKNYLTLISMRAKIHGFIVFDFQDRYAEAEREIARWIQEGKVKVRETRLKGLESCPEGLVGLFKGINTGKLVVQVGAAPGKL